MIRLNKVLADAGIASRRAAEKLIAEGHVMVNDKVVTELGRKVDPAVDSVMVDGMPVRPRRHIYVALHKPRGILCTRKDPEERATILELLPPEWSNLHTVGRLDKESEGLIFLTNDGEFTLKLTHPRFGIRKIYIATVKKRLDDRQLARLIEGVTHDGEQLKAERTKLLSANNSHSVVEVELAQGRNREVRRLFEVLGHEVVTLRRVQIGPIKLGELPLGRWRILTGAEVKSLLHPAA